ncbi:MAG: CPBP family intramembrane metalloprotease [Lachnospiraceae bacterium]|nr:CPBP family intramembrane metalloprotease [Lachnospiraceae bacterium]
MKTHIINLLPFNNRTEIPASEYVIKKVLAFILIFYVAGVLGEAAVIALYTGMGYDPLHGVMPEGQIAALVPYYGYILFSIVAILYCILIEKRSIQDIGITKKPTDYLIGIVIAVTMLVLVVLICILTGSATFIGINRNVNIKGMLLWALAFIIQGSEEEILCRGFLMNTLKKKISVPLSVLISSTAFVVPHLIMTPILDSGIAYATIGIINLYLISILFSVITLWRNNIWISCGLHAAWNYILNIILGLTVSGNEAKMDGLLQIEINKLTIINGSEYGLEAGIATTAITIITICVIMYIWKGRKDNGIQ